MHTLSRLMLVGLVLSVSAPALRADSDSADLQRLMRQVEQLEQRVATLEAARSFTRFMPNLGDFCQMTYPLA